jgi:hypothetical protein
MTKREGWMTGIDGPMKPAQFAQPGVPPQAQGQGMPMPGYGF